MCHHLRTFPLQDVIHLAINLLQFSISLATKIDCVHKSFFILSHLLHNAANVHNLLLSALFFSPFNTMSDLQLKDKKEKKSVNLKWEQKWKCNNSFLMQKICDILLWLLLRCTNVLWWKWKKKLQKNCNKIRIRRGSNICRWTRIGICYRPIFFHFFCSYFFSIRLAFSDRKWVDCSINGRLKSFTIFQRFRSVFFGHIFAIFQSLSTWFSRFLPRFSLFLPDIIATRLQLITDQTSSSIVSLGQVHQNAFLSFFLSKANSRKPSWWLNIATWTYLKESLKLALLFSMITSFAKR